jgi:excisionase family DNA binding protein
MPVSPGGLLLGEPDSEVSVVAVTLAVVISPELVMVAERLGQMAGRPLRTDPAQPFLQPLTQSEGSRGAQELGPGTAVIAVPARIGIRWHTGASEELTVARIGPGRTSREAMAIIRANAATTTDADLAAELNAAGLTTGRGHRFDAAAVHRARNANGIRAPWSTGACDGAITIPQVCQRLGVSKSTVLDWVYTGKLAAHQTPARRWHIPWDDTVEAHCRHMIATSIRLPARTRQPDKEVAV